MRTSIVSKWTLVFVLVSKVVIAGTVNSDVVVAGSSLEAPPPFWEDSFWGVTANIDRAFPFEVLPSGPFLVDELQVPAYHYELLSGSIAEFSLHNDDSGTPGSRIATFNVSEISTSQVVLSSLLAEPVLLEPHRPYWIIGSTPSGQVNWNLGANVFGEAAFRVRDGDWTFLDRANVSGFALLGTQVPEPSMLILLGASGLVLCLGRCGLAIRRERR